MNAYLTLLAAALALGGIAIALIFSAIAPALAVL